MDTPSAITGEQLASALNSLGVRFIMGGQGAEGSLHKQPARLLAALAQSDEARLRLALIPLLLEHPEFATHVRAVSNRLDPTTRLTLQCYYTAALWLGERYHSRRKPLPDLFSQDLQLSPTGDPEKNLHALADRHQELSGVFVNWFGTYQHAAKIWRLGLEFT